MATTSRHRYLVVGLIASMTFAAVALCNCTFGMFERQPTDISMVSVLHDAVDFSWLTPFAASPAEEIQLQAAIATSTPLKDPPTLNGRLRSIDIRTALEETQRLQFELG